MKKLIIIAFLVGFSVYLFAQDTTNDNTTNEISVKEDTGRLLLRELSVDTFDDPTLWQVQVPIDKGVTDMRRILGGPSKKEKLRVSEQVNEYNPSDNYVLGVRVDYFSRSNTRVGLKAVRPQYVPGIVKKLSVWVAGRGKDHNLSVVIRDMAGAIKTLPLGKLGYFGWKKLETSIPLDIDQNDRNGGFYGLYIIGFIIDTKFEETVGKYYVYFDDMRAVSDVINEALRDEDDIADGW